MAQGMIAYSMWEMQNGRCKKDDSQVSGLITGLFIASFTKTWIAGERQDLEMSKICFLLDMLILKCFMGYLDRELI